MLVACAGAGIDLRSMHARAVRDEIAAATEVAPEEPRSFELIVCVCVYVCVKCVYLCNIYMYIYIYIYNTP